MEITEYISKMKAPSDKRPTWGEGIIQIHITRACDLSCIGCTQGSNLSGKPVIMSSEEFTIAAESLKDYYGIVGIFGGNPCIHPEFETICSILSDIIPWHRRGLWSNNLNGHGKVCRETFNPEVSNLNVHMSTSAYLEMKRDWPESHPKGMSDSRHSPPYVALQDIKDLTDENRWKLISECDINQLWSAMICTVPNRGLRGYFCELAGAQAMLHPEYPDTGIEVYNENAGINYWWWRLPISDYSHQIQFHCFKCGIPLRGKGDLAVTGSLEQVSATHMNIYKLKSREKHIQVIEDLAGLNGSVRRATDYIENSGL